MDNKGGRRKVEDRNHKKMDGYIFNEGQEGLLCEEGKRKNKTLLLVPFFVDVQKERG